MFKGRVQDILEARRRRLTAAGKGLPEETELSAFFSPTGLVEPPSEDLLARMLDLPRSERLELAAILAVMAMRAERHRQDVWERILQS